MEWKGAEEVGTMQGIIYERAIQQEAEETACVWRFTES